MRVVLDYYFDDLEQRCLEDGCGHLLAGPYSEEWRGSCPCCNGGRRGFFRAFGTEKQRSVQVRREQARISGWDY